MNHLFAILIAIFLSSCGSLCPDCGKSYPIEATFYFINETDEPIISTGYENIAPKDTLKINIKADTYWKTTIDNFPTIVLWENWCGNMNITYLKKEKANSKDILSRKALSPAPPFSFNFCSMLYLKEDTLKQEYGIGDIQNYEDKKEVSPSVFELTFRFTEERKAKASLYGYYPVKATFYFINETADLISHYQCGDIAPKDTLKINIGPILEAKEKPTIDNFPLPICNLRYKDGDLSRCEYDLLDIKKYEDRKKIAPLSFEFTFRFTEEKKAKAEACSGY